GLFLGIVQPSFPLPNLWISLGTKRSGPSPTHDRAPRTDGASVEESGIEDGDRRIVGIAQHAGEQELLHRVAARIGAVILPVPDEAPVLERMQEDDFPAHGR